MKTKNIGTVLIASALLSGCATTSKQKPLDPAMEQMKHLAESVLMHEKRLADIRAAQHVEQNGSLPGKSDLSMFPELSQHVSLGVDWHGPLDALIKRLAAFCNYTTHFVGNKPPGNVLVSVNTDYRRIIDILYDAGVKSGHRAHVKVRPDEKMIEVEYVGS